MIAILLFNWNLIEDDPVGFIAAVIPMYCFFLILLIPMLVFHEISHGWVANRLGDDTAKNLGRLSLNPLKHLDRNGTLMFLIVGIGRAKPVPVNPYRLMVTPRKGMAIIAAAGPFTNFLAALLCAMVFRLNILSIPSTNEFIFGDMPAYVLLTVIQINVLLAVFNMLPIPPFDGFKVVAGLLPRDQAMSFSRIERYTPQIFIGLFFFLFFTGFFWQMTDFFANVLIGEDVY